MFVGNNGVHAVEMSKHIDGKKQSKTEIATLNNSSKRVGEKSQIAQFGIG
jgi:hypothetical protein